MRRHVWLLALLAVVPCGLASCARSSTLAVYRDLEYERVADQPVRLDAYVPLDGRTHRGAVVVVHGGGWAIGDKESLAPEARAFAEAGLVAFSVDYRLGSAGRFPQALEDVRAAVRWVQDRAGRFSIDPARVGIFGTSAGGNLALMVATTGVGGAPVRHPRVAAAVSWSGPTDLRVLALVPRGASRPIGCRDNLACAAFDWPAGIESYLGCSVAACASRYADASPVSHVSASSPPTALFNSADEVVPLEQVTRMEEALRRAGVRAEVTVYAGDRHADAYRADATGPSTEFLVHHLGGGRSLPASLLEWLLAGLLVGAVILLAGRAVRTRRWAPGQS